jgi:hypothetical protein
VYDLEAKRLKNALSLIEGNESITSKMVKKIIQRFKSCLVKISATIDYGQKKTSRLILIMIPKERSNGRRT